MTTNDIRTFAKEHFQQDIERVEWIDDYRANLVYKDDATAREALLALSANPTTDISPLQTVLAKAISSHPQATLEVRMAVIGDRKQAGARDRSRFYLLHPEYEPDDRRRRGNGRRGGNRYRDSRDGDYHTNRYNDREHRKRQVGDEQSAFDASLYDDDEEALALRASKKHGRSDSMGSEDGSRRVRFRGAAGKELFPDRGNRRAAQSGRLRDRSASPRRDSDEDRALERSKDNAASANRLKAQMIKVQLRAADPVKELFPGKAVVNHRRSAAVDETADLFAHKMPVVPFLDGSSDARATASLPLSSRITSKHLADRISPGLNIRGAAGVPATQTFSIKGSAASVKELFPARTGTNAGKELFSERLEGRGGRRKRAEDLFS